MVNGWKTSEFWFGLLTMAAIITLAVLGVKTWVGMILSAQSMLYTYSRTHIKAIQERQVSVSLPMYPSGDSTGHAPITGEK